MKWIDSNEQTPPIGERVLGLKLGRYINTDWKWEWAYFTNREITHAGDERWNSSVYSPDLWARIELPPVPESPAREASRLRGEKEAELERKIALLEAERRALWASR